MGKLKILIVDDEKEICTFIKRIYRKKDFIVYSAHNGTGAIKLAKTKKPDILLLDIRLGRGIDGIQALRRIREFNKQIITIVVTYLDDINRMKETKKLGAISYLVKPLTLNELNKAINKAAKLLKKE